MELLFVQNLVIICYNPIIDELPSKNKINLWVTYLFVTLCVWYLAIV